MLKAIIADDETMIKRSLKMIVERTSLFEVAGQFTNGRDALEYMKATPADLVITDIRMPVMDGLNLISAMREMGLEADVIIVTGYGEFEYAQRAIRYGVTDYLPKPIVPDQLQRMLEQIASRRERQIWTEAWRQEAMWYCKKQGVRLSALIRDMDGAAVDSLLEEAHIYISRYCGEQPNFLRTFYADLLTFACNELKTSMPELQEAIHPHLTQAAAHTTDKMKAEVREQVGVWMKHIAAVRNHGMHLTTKKALSYIQEHAFDEELSLQRVADEMKLSVSYMSECIKEMTGIGFTQYVTALRLERAKELLADSSCKMYEAAYLSGYADYAHFTKTFKKHYGYSPKEYRERLQGRRQDESSAKK